MKTKNSSEITLAEATGLIRDLLDKLIGKRAQFWLSAFKRFLRKENPWPPMQKLSGERPLGTAPCNFDCCITALEEVGVDCSAIKKYSRQVGMTMIHLEDLSIHSTRPVFHMVEIRVGDMLSPEERVKFNYDDLLVRAGELGLTPCDVTNGLAGLVITTGDLLRGQVAMKRRYVICSEPYLQEGDGYQRIFDATIWPGSGTKNNGSIMPVGLDRSEVNPLNFQRDPEVRMIFMSVIE